MLRGERLWKDLLESRADGRLEEEPVEKELGELQAAEMEVAIGSEFLQGVVQLLYLLSDLRASSSSRRIGGSPKAARISEIFGFADIVMSESKAERCKEMRIWE